VKLSSAGYHRRFRGYIGLFGNNSGMVKDFSINGTIGTEASPITSGFNNIGAAVGYNSGTVTGVTGNVSIYVEYVPVNAIGGIVGQNAAGGTVTQCVNYTDNYRNEMRRWYSRPQLRQRDKMLPISRCSGNGGGQDSIAASSASAATRTSPTKTASLAATT
jgi:hypothetical protein